MRRLIASFGQLALSSLLGQVIGFAVLASVARRVGPTVLGAYGYANNLIPYILLPMSGLTAVATRDIARDKLNAAVIAGSTLPLLGVYSLVATLGLWLLAPVLTPTHLSAHMLRILALTVGITLFNFDWVLQGLQVFKELAVGRLTGQAVYGVAAIVWLTGGVAGGYRYAWLNVLGLAVTLVVILVAVVRRTGPLRLRTSLRASLRRLRDSTSFTLSLAMIKVYYSSDIVLLGVLSTSRAVGQYVVAYKLPQALLQLSTIGVGVVFPHSARQDRAGLRRHMGLLTTASVALLLPVCAGSIILARPLMVTLFGATYTPAALYFQLVMISSSFAIVNSGSGTVLLALGEERVVARSFTVGAIMNVGLNLVLIPIAGPKGAALATIVSEAGVFLFLYRYIFQKVGRPSIRWARIAASGVSTTVMCLVLVVLTESSLFVRVPAGAAAFTAAAVVTGLIRPSDRRLAQRD